MRSAYGPLKVGTRSLSVRTRDLSDVRRSSFQCQHKDQTRSLRVHTRSAQEQRKALQCPHQVRTTSLSVRKRFLSEVRTRSLQGKHKVRTKSTQGPAVSAPGIRYQVQVFLLECRISFCRMKFWSCVVPGIRYQVP